MEFTPEKLLAAMERQSDLPNVIAVVGEETYYHHKILSEVKKYVFGDTPEADREFSQFDKDTELQQVEAAVNTYPFFCGRSLVIVRDEKFLGDMQSGDEKRKNRFLKLLSDVPEHCFLVLSAQKIDKRGKAYKLLKDSAAYCASEPLKIKFLAQWLEEKASVYKRSFDYEAIRLIEEYLLTLENIPMLLLEKEVEKLYVYAGERKVWTKNDVETVFAELPEVSRFALTNALSKKELTRTLTILRHELKQGAALIKLCGMLNATIRRMIMVKELFAEGKTQQQIASELQMAPYAVKVTLEQGRKYSVGALTKALLGISELNSDLRRGGRQADKLEEILIKLMTE